MKQRAVVLLLIHTFLLGLLLPRTGAASQDVNIHWLPDGVEVATDRYSGEDAPTLAAQDLIVVTRRNNSGTSLYGLASRDGKLVLPVEYQNIQPYAEGLAMVAKKGLCGFVDQSGKLVIPLQFQKAGSFSEGLAWAVKYEDRRTRTEFVDRKGKEILLTYPEASNFSDGLSRVMSRDKDGKVTYGYVLKTGKTVVQPIYDAAEDYQEGLALVMKRNDKGEEKYGFLDKAGNLAVPLEYDAAEPFSGGLAAVMKRNVGWGFVDPEGKVVVPLRYSGVGTYSEGFAPVVKRDANGNKKYGFVNSFGKLTVPLQYNHASGFSGGLAVAMRLDENGDPKYGFIDKDGNTIIRLEYDSALLFSEGLALVMRQDTGEGKRACFVDKTGREILPLHYEGVRSFSQGYARVIRLLDGGSRRYGFIDKRGTEILSPIYPVADLFPGSTTGYVMDEDGRYGMFTLPTAAPVSFPSGLQLARAATQTVEVDGKQIEFQMYAVLDENGAPTNYVKLRDIAQVLNGTAAQFSVSWNGSVNIETGQPYTPNGSEMKVPFSGDRPFATLQDPTIIDGQVSDLSAILLTSDSGNGYTYYRLRTLGQALGFNVGWSVERGVYIESDQPYGAGT